MVEMADLCASMWRIEEKLRRMNEILDRMNGVAPPPSSRTASTPSTPISVQVVASPASGSSTYTSGRHDGERSRHQRALADGSNDLPYIPGSAPIPKHVIFTGVPNPTCASSSCSTGVARAQGPGAAAGVDPRLGCAVPDDGHAARPRVPAEDPGPTLLQSRRPRPPGDAAAHG